MPYPAPSANRYLDARVTTASQPELQLMMLDGALRNARHARQLWDDEPQQLEIDRLLRRTLDIVEELVRSVAAGRQAESKRLEEEYAFIFRELAEGHLSHDAAKVDSVLKLLEFQRETWRQACEKLKQQAPAAPNLDFGHLPQSGLSVQA